MISLFKTLHFPYQSLSLNGLFRQVSQLTGVDDLYKAKFIGFSSTKAYFPVFNLIGIKKTNNYWISKPDNPNDWERWFIIDFKRNRLHIQGYTMYNIGGADALNSWQVLISNDMQNWTIVHDGILTRQPGDYISYTPTNPNSMFPARYLKVRTNGVSFGFKDNRFSIYGFDVFGIFYSCFFCSKSKLFINIILFPLFISCFILM